MLESAQQQQRAPGLNDIIAQLISEMKNKCPENIFGLLFLAKIKQRILIYSVNPREMLDPFLPVAKSVQGHISLHMIIKNR